ncbi:uncharacterized protein LOC131636998 [Vicia villosa]|uniref:uncharacterized protein LOC131636998 n=1 Tax=Vicia villosa TaxID=3911 RepID=UPI00273C8DC9|nr:uncharacterized protein LOC131636998 [Vicia villosa]
MELCGEEEGAMKKITSRIGDGHSILFWKSKWIGADALYLQFPALFNEINFKNISVFNVGFWNGDIWEWKLIHGEEVLGRDTSREYMKLKLCMVGIGPTASAKDRLIWPYESSNCFSVKSCYMILIQNSVMLPMIGLMESLSLNWGAALPSKIEDTVHIFLQCTMLVSLKRRVFSWIEIQMPAIEDCGEFLLYWTEKLQGTMKNNIAAAIWLTFCWCI